MQTTLPCRSVHARNARPYWCTVSGLVKAGHLAPLSSVSGCAAQPTIAVATTTAHRLAASLGCDRSAPPSLRLRSLFTCRFPFRRLPILPSPPNSNRAIASIVNARGNGRFVLSMSLRWQRPAVVAASPCTQSGGELWVISHPCAQQPVPGGARSVRVREILTLRRGCTGYFGHTLRTDGRIFRTHVAEYFGHTRNQSYSTEERCLTSTCTKSALTKRAFGSRELRPRSAPGQAEAQAQT